MRHWSCIRVALVVSCVGLVASAQNPPMLMPLVPPADLDVHDSIPGKEGQALPVADAPFEEHVRVMLPASFAGPEMPVAPVDGLSAVKTRVVMQGDRRWVGTEDGLYSQVGGGDFVRHARYGIDGPPSNVIAGLVADSKGVLWVATPAGLASRDGDGVWTVIRGKEGLPWEELTCIAVNENDQLWLGSTRGLIQYRPYEEGRKWYYRAGPRYLPDDHVVAVEAGVAFSDGKKNHFVLAKTAAGWGRIDTVERTLHGKAEYLQARYQERHKRNGMPAPAHHDDAYAMKTWTHDPQPSDGLWTSYYVTAMSMAYSLTGEDRYKAAAKEGMEALYLLQNITGIKGLVARSFVRVDEPAAEKVRGQANWLPTKDGKYLWRDDVSSDQISGHYFAFYTYYEHIAKHDPEEKARLDAQIRQVTDYIVDNNYQIFDWDGERTMWGWWNPEELNGNHVHYLEAGLYSLMMLSFLKTAYYVTDDEKYMGPYRDLIENHHYLSNLLLQKKDYPDELNHSDDQLSAVVFYPYLQMEHDPMIRDAVYRALRRHARIERDERNSLMAFVYGSVAPEDADVMGGLQTLREMPQDRRNWRMENLHRADVVVQHRLEMGGDQVLRDVLPADEREFERWNADPYRADGGGDGRTEGDGVSYLLAYWMARYHGLLAAPAL